jgi:hypothetical protein
MDRKRKKAGRPPRGPFKGKRALLGTRITPETRKDLEAAAREHGRSISQEAEYHLKRSLQRVHNPRDDIVALTEAIALAIKYVERTTGERWIDSAFTTTAAQRAIDFLLRHFGAHGSSMVPLAIKQIAATLPTDYAAKYCDPAEVGIVEGGRLISEIESRDVLESDVDPIDLNLPGTYVPSEWRRYRTILRNLRSGRSDINSTARRRK